MMRLLPPFPSICCLLGLLLFVAAPLTAVQHISSHHLEATEEGSFIDRMLEDLAILSEKHDFYEQKRPETDFYDGVSSFTTNGHSPKFEAFGYADYYNNLSMAIDNRFPIASNTKLYTAVAIYQLAEEGKLDMDADLSTMLDAGDFKLMGLPPWRRHFCPRLKYHLQCEMMTLRNLLSMSSGIYPALNCDTDKNPGSCNRVPYVVNQEGSIARTVGTFITEPLIFRPGTEYHYSNPNFIFASYFVEKYSGMTFRDYLQNHIFDRIGLNNTYFDYFNGAFQMDKRRVRPFFKYYDVDTLELLSVGANTLQLDLGAASGTGGVLSTATDEINFWYSLFNRTSQGAPLLSDPASLQSILTAWSLVGQGSLFWNGKRYETWAYYTQGVSVLCSQKDCLPDGPRWLVYEGGTITVGTANVMDLKYGAMAQMWISTLVAMPSREDFYHAIDSQTGIHLEFISEWVKNAGEQLLDPIALCFLKLLPKYPPDDSTMIATPE